LSDEKISTNQRVAIAFGLWLVFMLVWGFVFKPSKPLEKPPQSTSAPAPGGASPATTPAGAPATVSAAPATPLSPEATAAATEQTTVIDNDLYRVEISNRGGVAKSWRLKKYKDHENKPLELVNTEASQQLGGWPFTIALADAALDSAANAALYVATDETKTGTGAGASRREVTFEWSDGKLHVTKKFRFDASYLFDLDTSVTLDGKPLAHSVAWRGGFGDVTEFNHADQMKVFYFLDSKLRTLENKNLGMDDNRAQRKREEGTMRYAGIEDRYFAAAFLSRGARPEELGPGLALWHWRSEREIKKDNTTEKQYLAEMSAGSTQETPLALRVFVGPKALDELRATRPPLTELVQFGWLSIISEPLFYFLKWIHNYVPNYGWAIILMTLAINIALFPLKVSSWRSMQKMQKVGPEMKQLQDKYKKYSMTDPRRQKMNEEMMALYKREGVNPYGSCLPMLLQMPIWLALYSMLGVAIELRHAPWVWWIKDLSARDPYFILPLAMVATMWISQKMTPMTTMDPAQQRMMTFMPLMFGVMFVIFPVSSGLVLYILTSTLIGIAQQWYLNKTGPAANGGKK
jgi:YidC/Oxa1 family membrane protein insertase